MIVVVDERELVKDGYTSLFGREGVPSTGFDPSEFGEWVSTAADADIDAVEAFLIGQCEQSIEPAARDPGPVDGAGHRAQRYALARKHTGVVRVRRRRRRPQAGPSPRDPGPRSGDPPPPEGHWRTTPTSARSASSRTAATRKSHGDVFALPRRERRILEYLVANRGRRVSKTQIFNAIYGIFDEEVEENVVESHISKLRKKLRKRLGFDPIDSKRFLGYCIDWS